MCEVSAVRKVKTHECLARSEACHHDCHVGLRSRMRLHVCILCLEQFAKSVDGELLDLVNHLASAVISCSRITLCILVCAD